MATSEELYAALSNYSGFLNSGYWLSESDDLESAQNNLIGILTAKLNRRGKILDVACGNGASIRYLANYFEEAAIYGIDVADDRVRRAKAVAPNSNIFSMSATQLMFDSKFFDNVLCIGSAVYFEPREDFLKEAYRVLKGDGILAMYDVIESAPKPRGTQPEPITDLSSYKKTLHELGFREVSVKDVSDRVFAPFDAFMARFSEHREKNDDGEEWSTFRREIEKFMRRWKSYALIIASK